MRTEIKQYLQHIKSICPELTDAELIRFSQGLTVSELAKKDFCITYGEIQKQGGYLVNGLIRAFYSDDSGNEKNIYFIPENEYCFHYLSFMDKTPCPLSFQCIEPCVVVNFPIDHIYQAYIDIPKFEQYGRRIMEQKFKAQQQRLESFLFQNAEQRYIDFIQQYPQLFNRISLSQLCSYLGVERQTLTRIRKKISSTK
ncbi:MAG: cAMP-binding protein [Gammaproteobacteria bacterium]|nr:MAG: cAMP-binding protein [Gammaproteobacteria bacterium]